MSVLDVRNQIAAYIQVPLSEFLVDGTDIGLLAMNNARKHAEKVHEWNCQVDNIYLPHNNGKGSWAVGLTEVDGLSISVKQPETFYVSTDGGETQTETPHTTKKNEANRSFEQRHYGQYTSRHLADDEECLTSDILKSVLHGYNFAFNSKLKSNVTVWLDCYKWLDSYTEDEQTDFFIEHGAEYLMWAAVVETNYHFGTFVPQQEGTLSPPEKARDKALFALTEFDSFQLEGSRIL